MDWILSVYARNSGFFQGCGVADGVGSQAIFGARESGVAKFFFKMPHSLEMSHFYVKNLRKCDISVKTCCENCFLQNFFGWLTVAN